MVRVGDVKTFKNFLVSVPAAVDPTRYNTVVIWCETFGQFILQPPGTVARGTTVRTIHRSGNPRNDLRRNDSYVRIERDLGGGNWSLVAWDGIPETVLVWARDAKCPDPNNCYWSTMDVFWAVPPSATPGTYRIQVFGAWKNGVTGAITPYQSTSVSFTVQ